MYSVVVTPFFQTVYVQVGGGGKYCFERLSRQPKHCNDGHVKIRQRSCSPSIRVGLDNNCHLEAGPPHKRSHMCSIGADLSDLTLPLTRNLGRRQVGEPTHEI